VNAKRRRVLDQAYAELKWRQYQADPAMFFEECLQIPAGEIMGGTSGRTNFELFDYQRETLDIFLSERYIVVLKARQLGLTTLAMAYALWMLMFRPGSNIVMVSRSQTAADKALEMIDFMWSFLPAWVLERGPKLDNDAAKHHSYKFSDGMVSRITSYAATRTVAAGQTATLVLWDEAALAEYQDDALRTLLPTTDAGGSMIVFSTARGGHNSFARLYRDAERGENQFVPIFHPWYVSRFMNPGVSRETIDYTHYEAKKRAMASEPWLFYAEYPSSAEEAFRQSGRSRFANLPDVEDFDEFPLRGRFINGDYGRVTFQPDEEGPLRLREEALLGVPVGCRPVISLDPASGTGGDYTSMSMGWVDHDGVPQRMGFWHSNMVEPSEYSVDAMLTGQFFADSSGRDALMVVERQGGYGDTVVHIMRSEGYTNLYVHRYTGHRKYRQDQMYGFPMTATRRPLVVDTLAKWLDFDNDTVMGGVDLLLRRELGAFVVRPDGKIGADVGMHDDLVMSTAIWVYVAEQYSPKATNGHMDELVDNMQVFTVNHIFDEAAAIWRQQDRDNQKYARRMRRAGSWR
jgi:hypothetical protein